MSKEFESLCLTSQVHDCLLPTQGRKGKGREGKVQLVVPHLAELWQYSWVPAGEGPLHSRDCFVQHAVVLCQRFLGWAFTKHLPKGMLWLCWELKQHQVCLWERGSCSSAEVKEKPPRATAEGSSPPLSQQMQLSQPRRRFMLLLLLRD